MNSVVEKIYDKNKDLWGEPQDYRGIKIHPLKLKDVEYQSLFYGIFMHPKNHIPEKEVIKMSYLKFLLYGIALSPQGIGIEKMRDDIVSFLQYVTNSNDIGFEIKDHPTKKDMFLIAWHVGDVMFSENDFDNIREIVLEQNGFSIEYVEGYIADLEESLEFLNRHTKDRTIADNVFTFCALADKSTKDIEEYTLHQFNLHLQRMMVLEDYRLYMPLVVSGQITLKHGKIDHYSKHISNKTGRYDGLIINKNEFDGQFKVPKANINNEE